jgi:uncharacterized BrkB/YihY/UPF0761 family membrane protein
MSSATHHAKDTSARTTRPRTVWLYVAGALGLGVTALFGGGTLVADPSGERMEMPLTWLDGTPFTDYFVPGSILFTVLGVGSFVVLYGVLRRRPWGWWAAIGLGVALVGWIVTQMLLIQMVHALHAIYGGLGILLVGLASRPSMREYLDHETAPDTSPWDGE